MVNEDWDRNEHYPDGHGWWVCKPNEGKWNWMHYDACRDWPGNRLMPPLPSPPQTNVLEVLSDGRRLRGRDAGWRSAPPPVARYAWPGYAAPRPPGPASAAQSGDAENPWADLG